MSYQQSAYSSEQAPVVISTGHQTGGLFSRLVASGRSVLGFNRLCGQVPLAELKAHAPSAIREVEARQEKQLGEGRTLAQLEADAGEGGWDHLSLFKQKLPPFYAFRIFIGGIGKIVCFLFFLYLFVLLIELFISGDFNTVVSGAIDYLLYAGIPSSVLWAQASLLARSKGLLSSAIPDFKLCRHSGMVTFYRKGKVYFCHPFVEFDCYLISTPDQQSFLSHGLLLVHREKDYAHGVPLSSLLPARSTPDELKRLWNMLQQYMDVSRPLPDLPVLEPFRQRDATTAEADRQSGRASRYWRDMSDSEFAQAVAAHQKRQETQPVEAMDIRDVQGKVA